MRKLRVLTILHELSLTGAPKIALDACDALQEDVEPFFLSLRDGSLEGRCRNIGPLDIIPTSHQAILGMDRVSGFTIKYLFREAKKLHAKIYFSKLQKKIKAWRPDIVYINSVGALHLLETLDLSFLPTLLHVHELNVGIRLGIGDGNPLLTKRPNKYIAVAKPVQDLLVRRFGIDSASIALVHEFVPDADFHKLPPDADKNGDNRFIVGGAGQPGWRKGTTLWLQMAVALTHIMGEGHVRFVWVGLGSDFNSIFFEEEARKFKLDNLIDFVPATKYPLPHYANFDVFAMTSFEDPCPLVVLENMMLKKPVFCFAGSGGAPEEVGDTGIVINEFNPLAMARAIAELADNPELRKSLGVAARKRVEKYFTAGIQAPKILAQMQSLLEPNEVEKH